jgi:hypothetical protein
MIKLLDDRLGKSWYENDSRYILVNPTESVLEYLLAYGRTVLGGINSAEIVTIGNEDKDEWGYIVLTDQYLPYCIREIKLVGNKLLYHFYTFTKQNLMFQATNLMKNTPKYTKLYKSFQNAYNDLDEEGYYQYQKESMQIPLPFTGSDGNQLFLKTNLPLSDLGEWLENPVQRLVASSTPFLKVPFEKATGVNTFTGEPLNNKTVDDFANALGISLPKWVQDSTSAAEHILNSFGLQNVSTNLLKKVTTILEASQGNASPQDIWAEIFRSVLQNTNQENVALNNVYDDLELYQNEVSRLKKQGIDIPTIREITTSNKIKINNLKNKRASSK